MHKDEEEPLAPPFTFRERDQATHLAKNTKIAKEKTYHGVHSHLFAFLAIFAREPVSQGDASHKGHKDHKG